MADLKQFLEEASVEFLMLGGANDRLEERELLKEQKVKAEEAKAQASNLQCQLDEMRGATSVDDSALEVERKSKASVIAQQEVKMQKTTSTSNVKLVEVEVRAGSLEQELMCWLAETGSQEGSSWRISRYLNHRGRGKSPEMDDWSPE